jgi:alkanesulfonate monooxygenase SsuD/methylene tetrahydromethanopterin reductase-like flavin-dependent oxidoreductase (luciferase family)
LLGALAAATRTIGLGSMVANVSNRPPGVLMTAAASVQAISGGRFVLGIGGGAAPGSPWAREHEVLDIALLATQAERQGRVEAVIDLLHEVWDADRPERFAGMPLPVPPPPIVVGVNSATALAQLAGRKADGVNVAGTSPKAEALLTAAAHAHSASARTSPWDASVWAFWRDELLDPDHPDRRRWASWGVTRLLLVGLQPLADGTVERAARWLR